MNTLNQRRLLSVLFLGVFVLCASAAPASAAADNAPEKKAAPPTVPNPESLLKPAMAVDAVRKIMGKPDVVKPMKAPDGKAEIWIYRRTVNERFSREEAGSVPIVVNIPNTDGTLRQYTVGENTRFVDVKFVTEDVIELLLFNDRYVTQKTTRREYKRLG